jgi:putative ABC transport system substrate-binding protein
MRQLLATFRGRPPGTRAVAVVIILCAVMLMPLTGPLAAETQRSAKLPIIAYLSPFGAPPPPPAVNGFGTFLGALRDLGHVDGETVAIEPRFANGDDTRLPVLAEELIRLHPDVIVAQMNSAIVVAKQVAPTIPIVMAWAVDPIGMKFAASLARPGGQLTGLTWEEPYVVASKRLELLKELRPAIRRVAVVFGGIPGLAPYFADMSRRAPALGMQLTFIEVPSVGKMDAALAKMEKIRPDAIYAIPGGPLWEARLRLAAFAKRLRVPMISVTAQHVLAGALMSYGPDISALMTRAASYVDRILKGAKPADLPIEQPTTFELVINTETAKTLGLAIPPALLLRANRLVQ